MKEEEVLHKAVLEALVFAAEEPISLEVLGARINGGVKLGHGNTLDPRGIY